MKLKINQRQLSQNKRNMKKNNDIYSSLGQGTQITGFEKYYRLDVHNFLGIEEYRVWCDQ